MPNKLTINHIMNMIQAHNELCAYAPQAHRLGAYIEISSDQCANSFFSMFSDPYIFTSKQFWDLLNDEYAEDFIKAFVNAKFEYCSNVNYLEANFKVDFGKDGIASCRVIVSIWER